MRLTIKITHITHGNQGRIQRYLRTLVGLLGILLVGSQEPAFAQALGASSHGLGGIRAGMPSMPWAVFGNPAALPDSLSFGLGVTRSFDLKELNEPAMVFSLPVRGWRLGVGTATQGWTGFRLWETALSLSSHTPIVQHRTLYYGLRMRWQELLVQQPYQNDHALLVDFGLQWHPHRSLMVGFGYDNMAAARWHHGNTTLDRALYTGLRWQADPQMAVHLEHQHTPGYARDWISAVEWNHAGVLYLRMGLATEPVRWSSGVGVHRRSWQADLFMRRHRHEVLGWVNGLSVRWKP